MVKDHSDNERGNPLPPHGQLFTISSKGVFSNASSHRQVSTYNGLCYTSRGALAVTRLKYTEYAYTHTHTHTYICVCVCVCVCA